MGDILPEFENWEIFNKSLSKVRILNGYNCTLYAIAEYGTPRVDYPQFVIGKTYVIKWGSANNDCVIGLYDLKWNLREEIVLSKYLDKEYYFKVSYKCICLAIHCINYPGDISISGLSIEEKNSSNVSVTGVSLNNKSVKINIEEINQLTETISPSNATNKNVIWTSGNSKIAIISSTGLVT